MNRRQMIAAAANVLPYHWRTNPPGGECSCGHETPLSDQCSEHVARAVIDAILPQVTTVEELEALAVGTVLVSGAGEPVWVATLPIGNPEVHGYRSATHAATRYADLILHLAGPLTVVWRP